MSCREPEEVSRQNHFSRVATTSVYLMLTMLIVIQLVYSDPGLFDPLIEKTLSVLWCKPFL